MYCICHIETFTYSIKIEFSWVRIVTSNCFRERSWNIICVRENIKPTIERVDRWLLFGVTCTPARLLSVSNIQKNWQCDSKIKAINASSFSFYIFPNTYQLLSQLNSIKINKFAVTAIIATLNDKFFPRSFY